MSVVAQAEFAKAQGWHRSTVTRLKQAGRLVMDGNGVDVEASLARIAETGGMRFDVADRHAAQRAQREGQNAAVAPIGGAGEGVGQGGAAIGPPAPALTVPPTAPAPDTIGNSYQAARAVRERYNALTAKAEYETMIGNLIPKTEVDTALRHFATSVRARLDVFPDQVASLIAPITDLNDIHAVLAEHCRGILAEVADDMKRAEVAT